MEMLKHCNPERLLVMQRPYLGSRSDSACRVDLKMRLEHQIRFQDGVRRDGVTGEEDRSDGYRSGQESYIK